MQRGYDDERSNSNFSISSNSKQLKHDENAERYICKSHSVLFLISIKRTPVSRERFVVHVSGSKNLRAEILFCASEDDGKMSASYLLNFKTEIKVTL